ncbi:class III extradiol ring-cleavage dioxygenase [Pseudoalteromonas sp. MMG022]|uniref:DODA-type extradiol aromatic ring-opening family dioxygenase n=1 Tax=Pseudoalteromonas sp. MMG022 TaxID=2909978 RepID=UPI001F16101D|nr:class III extradiol ring-cleavage dioxygenase [Pseudoalteromonas sp. MMG022]MCF6437228.1 dioxygenase [Pseudoalteromonas sp. MMG022]
MNNARTIMYIAHGGGPMPLLGDSAHQNMIDTLKVMAGKIAKPSAILLISAHFEANIPTLTSGAKPNLIYDYHGFPKAAYDIQYPCKGAPQLAQAVQQCLQSSGINVQKDPQRGFDHGMFVPLKLMFPDADVPCVQLSLDSSLDATKHLAMGQALASLDWENLLIIGSGFSFHNMAAFFSSDDSANQKNQTFETWLRNTLTNTNITEAQRTQLLANWHTAPEARFCHPREEHLLPLHVCYGAARKVSDELFACTVLSKQSSMFLWHV